MVFHITLADLIRFDVPFEMLFNGSSADGKVQDCVNAFWSNLSHLPALVILISMEAAKRKQVLLDQSQRPAGNIYPKGSLSVV